MDKELEQFFTLIRKRLYRRLHALARPLSQLKDELVSIPSKEPDAISGCLCFTDGRYLFWDLQRLTNMLSTDMEEAIRVSEISFLHQVIHCLFGHPFSMPPSCPPHIWNLACDAASWYILSIWSPELIPEDIGKWLKDLNSQIPDIPLYQARSLIGCPALLSLPLCASDSHNLWPVFSQPVGIFPKWHGGPGENGNNGSETSSLWKSLGSRLVRQGSPLFPEKEKAESRQRTFGQREGGMKRTLSLTDARRHNYRSFLKSLSRWGEEQKINTEEFQYAPYLYGLEHYDGVPFLEPLEYGEAKKIRELAIVIDTSASCSHSLTQAFLEETRNLLLEEDLFFHPFNLHILQCDTKVERDDKITSPEDLRDYTDTLELCGMGGTDFRPAFSHIQKLREWGEFSDLSAILFFTDGLGIFPRKSPGIRTVFIFLKDQEYQTIDVPDWAEILVLDGQTQK